MNPFPLDGEYGLPLLGPKSPITEQGALDAAAIATSPVPILGDVVGLVADAKRMYDNPAERTPANVILAALGLIPFVPSGALTDKIGRLLGGWHASRNPSIYSPKPLLQRPFEHDYPKPGAAGGDGGSRVAFDIDGRQASPTALIAGRRTVGGNDIGLSRIDQDRAIGLLGIRFESVPRSGPGLKGDLGRYDHAN